MLFRSHLEGLVAAQVRFVVIGGVAAALHGAERVTLDLAICYDPAPDNRDRLAALLARWHAYLRGVEPGLPFVMDARTLHDTPVLTLTTDPGDLDLMDPVAGVGDYEAVRAASVEVDVDGLRFRALGLEALIAAKRATGRPKDRDRLPELMALLELRRKG